MSGQLCNCACVLVAVLLWARGKLTDSTLFDCFPSGVPDIAVGAHGDNAVYVLFLNRDGTVKAEQKISDTQGGLAASLVTGDQFGCALAGLVRFNNK